MRRHRADGAARHSRALAGFTLVELLVALFAMSLLAVMSWRGLDGMTRAQVQTAARADEVLTLQVGLAQWAADLDALVQLPQLTALDWNGRVLRLTRAGAASVADGVLVVAWTRREINGAGTWLRWQTAPLTTRGQVQEAWQQADIWSQNPGDQERRLEVAVTPLEEWQIFYHRGDAWTNPLSNDAGVAVAVSPVSSTPGVTATTPAAGSGSATSDSMGRGLPGQPAPGGINLGTLPDGVRLVLTLPPGQAIAGRIIRDWVRPTASGKKT